MIEVIKIDDLTYSIEDGGFVRYFLLIGDEKAALIDSGATEKRALEIAKGITDKEIILINTHGDGDHTASTASFDEIHMHKDDYYGCKINEKYPNTKLVELNDNDVIDLGNRPLRVIHIPGHTYGSLAFLDINFRVLIAGDSVSKAHIFMFGETRSLNDYEMSLNKLISMSDEYDDVWASHNERVLPKDYPVKVKNVWEMIKTGKILFEEIELHGHKIKSYTTDICGFYLQ